MNVTMIVLLLIHVLAAVAWVGGMWFAHFIMRPAALGFDPPQRLAFFRRVFERFFPAVGAFVVLLLVTGFAMVFVGFGGFMSAPEYVRIMMGLGIVMMLIFGHLYFVPWRRMRRALDGSDLIGAAAALNQIRLIVVFNLYLGLIVVAVAATGPYWGL